MIIFILAYTWACYSTLLYIILLYNVIFNKNVFNALHHTKSMLD